MIFCDNCLKEIVGGKFVYNPEKETEGKRFCSIVCMNEHYAPNCDQCGKKTQPWVHDKDKKDDKKFCSSTCMNKHYEKKTKESVVSFWQKHKTWIIGGGIVLIILIILGLVFGKKKK